MAKSLRDIIKHLFDSMDERRQLHSLDPHIQGMLDAALEKVIEGTDARIRAVPGYKRKLYKSILKSLEYADGIVEQIPHAIDLTPKHFVTDPYIRALFPTLSGLQRTFKNSSELHDFFSEPEHREASESYAFLCMHKQEKTILGMELQGDRLRRDVRQTRVMFEDHHVHAPAESEESARRELKCCIFEGLVNNALDKISELQARRHQLEIDQQRLNARLRSHRGDSPAGGDMHNIASEGLKLRSEALELERIEAELHEIGYVSPQISLDLVNDIMSNPEQFVRFSHISMHLDKEGIKHRKDDASPSINRLDFSEVRIKGQPPRVVTLANIHRDELEGSEPAGYDSIV